MSTTAILFLLFTCLALLFSGLLYMLVVVPSRRREIRRRLESLPELASGGTGLQHRNQAHDAIGRAWFEQALAKSVRARRFQLFVAQSGTRKSAGYWVVISLVLIVVGCLTSLIVQSPLFVTLLIIALLGGSPFLHLAYKRYQRFNLFERQLPDALDILARAVRAGYAFTSGLQVIAEEMPDPIAREFRKTYEQQNLGLPLRDALYNLSVRIPLPDVRIFVSTLQIQAESGGNLAEVLDKLASVVRDRFRLLQQVRICSAEGRMSMYALLGMPPLLVLAIFFLNPGYIGQLFSDPAGIRLLQGAMALQLIGYFVIRRLVNFQV